MEKIAISSDSTCAIERKEAEKLGIFILPLNVIVDEVEYHDGIDIDQPKLAKMMRAGSSIKTSTPTFGELDAYFDGIFAKGYEKIIHICISSKLTSIYAMTKKYCEEKYGDKVVVIDSLSVCSFMGNLVRYAKNLLDEGNTCEVIVDKVSQRISQDVIYFLPETLTYLKRGGRIKPAIALIGNMIGLKAILSLVDGAIEKADTTRVIKKSCVNILTDIKNKNLNPQEYELHLIHFDCDDLVNFVFEKASEILPGYTIQKSYLSINVCAHAGPGTIGIGITKKPLDIKE